MILKDLYYTSKAALRIFKVSTPRLIWKIAYTFGIKSMRNMARYDKRVRKGEDFFPCFMMISLTEVCNLSCSGCWVSRGGKKQLTHEQLDGIIRECKSHGANFFGLLGGEPFLYKGLLDIIEKHPDCYFQIFTNGTLITDEIAARMRKLGNVTPVISIEGLEEESDRRRQRDGVFQKTLQGMRNCRKNKLIFGAAASICKGNYDELVNEKHILSLAKEGAMYMWYYIYRPVGSEPNPEVCLDESQIRGLRKFLVDQRDKAPLFIIDTYWDDKGNAICPGASGMSHHIAPSGAVEFCPVVQMSTRVLNHDSSNLTEVMKEYGMISDMRKFTAEKTRGCILMEDPASMREFLDKEGAEDYTSRGTVREEYENMCSVPGHYMKDDPIPERNVIYRFLKKRYFFGFGAYG
ncbi:MAG: radical SAM protein [Bacteroidales bacterium]|nr:radical SAM protein [Bacteroidales bacterium]